MKKKDCEKLGKILLPVLPDGYVVMGRMVVAWPVGHLLRGLFFDSSSFSKEKFYVNYFLMPLSKPATCLQLTLGDRLKDLDGKDDWSSDRPDLHFDLVAAVRSKAVPFLEAAGDMQGAVRLIERMSDRAPGNPHVTEAMAFCKIMSGDQRGAAFALGKMLSGIDTSSEWQNEIAARASLILTLLRTSIVAAQDQLLIWENESAKQLGLERLDQTRSNS